MGYPPDLGWGTPQPWMGYPRGPGMGYPPNLGWDTPPPPGIGSTCYVAGGMPLAFTQEDFLVSGAVLCQFKDHLLVMIH